VARKIVDSGLARRAEVQVAYAIGRPEPVSTMVETFGTGDAVAAKRFVDRQDFSPAGMAAQLNLLRPIYAKTTNYGHFGRPGLPWES
jgi:S-adenosylmethionine synthetase